MGECWVLTDLVVPSLIFFAFVVMSVVALAALAENRRLLQYQSQEQSPETSLSNNGEVKPERAGIPSS